VASHRRAWLLAAVLLIITANFACSFGPGDSSDMPSPPGGQIPVSEAAANRLKENFQREMQEASTGDEFRLFVTNEEITSLVALTLQETSGVPLTEPQAWFTAGRVYITGTFSPLWPFNFRSLIVATAVVDAGHILIQVERAQMGPFPFPERVLASTSRTVNETLTQMQLDLEVTNLQILEGELQVAGTRRLPAQP
jgi:hypothetical protein